MLVLQGTRVEIVEVTYVEDLDVQMGQIEALTANEFGAGANPAWKNSGFGRGVYRQYDPRYYHRRSCGHGSYKVWPQRQAKLSSSGSFRTTVV